MGRLVGFNFFDFDIDIALHRRNGDRLEAIEGFTVKDVCDKIIHATNISKPVEHGVVGACARLSGHYKKKPWEFDLGVSIFCEWVLKWLEDIEVRLG